ncbi:biotin--[acetyl-CoA-carboxylase] ligase [Elusimicrobium posterum]|uniref:biotin--[acetyl-CoA-carboxylase] ligase n=1 Tax=Elusimicrobium posterum TaxID=3116653 RepID=UPI003C74D9C8
MISQIIQLENTDSTQNVGKAMARDGAPHGALILTKTQSAGRGQFERTWSSNEGGLYFSLILRPHKNILHTSILTIKAAEVVVETLQKLYGIKAKIKQPNDVLAYDKNKKQWLKICGILAETATHDETMDWIVLGIGINLNNTLDRRLTGATTVKKILGKAVDFEEFKTQFFGIMTLRYNQWLKSTAS